MNVSSVGHIWKINLFFEKGQYCVSDASGLGIKINDEEYERSFAQNKFELSL